MELPERLGTGLLPKGPDDCDAHYVFSNHGTANRRLVVDGALRIEAGTIIEFGANTLLDVRRRGSLTAIGTAAAPVVLRGAQQTQGYWYGICFGDNRASTLDHVHVLYGGGIWGTGESPVCEGAISGSATTGEPVSISNSLILGSAVSGVNTYNLRLGEFRNNVLAANQDFPVRVHASQAGSLDASNDFTGASLSLPNGDNRVFLWGVLDDGLTGHVWHDIGVPWYVGESGRLRYSTNVIVTDGASLTIGAGARFEFGAGSSFNVWDGATLNVQGDADDPVIFGGALEAPGSWKGLSFSKAGESTASHFHIRWAGDPEALYVGRPAAIHVYLSSLTLTDAVIHGSGGCAVSVANLNPGQVVDLVRVAVEEHGSAYPDVCDDVS